MNKLFHVIFLFIFLISPLTVNAHVLETSGEIGAVLHIDPDDDPYAKIPSQIYFDIKDKSNNFDITKCDCKFIVSTDSKVIHSQKVISQSVTYTFPQKGIYTISLNGTPDTDGKFSPFKLSYEIRVSREAEETILKSKNYLPVIFSTFFLVAFILLILKFKNKGISIILVLGLTLNLSIHLISHHDHSNILTQKQDCCLQHQVTIANSSSGLVLPETKYENLNLNLQYKFDLQFFIVNTGRSPPIV